MKFLLISFLLFTGIAFGQDMVLKDAERHVATIDRLRDENELVKFSYPNMSGCGGGVDGYLYHGKIVLIDATYNAELGYSSKTIYLNHDRVVKIIYHQHSDEWEEYEKKYPQEKNAWDPSKMIYSDSIITILLPVADSLKYIQSTKQSANAPDFPTIKKLLSCTKEMRTELQEVLNQIDSLRFVTEMPYICETSLCGDHLFWDAVQLNQNGLELLIDKLDDSTSTSAIVPNFGYYYTVADIAYDALKEIIHDIPTFELLGVPFDKEGCGYCSYYQYLNKGYENRMHFKSAVKYWFKTNKSYLIWVKSNVFASCDCSGQHPNGGHYVVSKTINK